jgi:hypothetical protein
LKDAMSNYTFHIEAPEGPVLLIFKHQHEGVPITTADLVQQLLHISVFSQQRLKKP